MTILEKEDIGSNITKMYLFKILSGVVFFAPVLMIFKEANGVSVPFYFLMVVVALSFKEPQRVKVMVKKGYSKEFFLNVKSVLEGSSRLQWIILYSALVLAFNQSVYRSIKPTQTYP